ncbi:guanine nucleotide binding protein, alpha subunit [Lipomyces arxii]|uniref:guanine nucleotide binding protein, alpha subunit n=1 Tax=Lipomyces arxii TaxID=56418 RepID=UPI0034CD5726
MGCGLSTVEDLEKAQNDKIENELKQQHNEQRNQIKMLLLGAGESGKSTIIKQMKLIHEGGYTRDERVGYREIIFSNVVQSMKVIIVAMESLEIPFADPVTLTPLARLVYMIPNQIEDGIPSGAGVAINALWHDAGVQEVFRRSREFQLNDSARYYFDSIDRLADPSYVPTDQDVLRARVKSTGITETKFRIGELTYLMYDVGGQRSERKKWIHCFENVTTILFLVAISEYDQMLFEDEAVNRMDEALTLFESVCNSRWFVKTSMILFLNKIDIFREKIKTSSLKRYFPDYDKQEYDYAQGCDFILNKFVYTHFTCATDTNQIKFVMAAVNDIIIQENLRETGLI